MKPLDEAAKRAAEIMRLHKPQTMGELFAIARGKALAAGEVTPFLDVGGDCENGQAWAIVDAHYANLNNPIYRAEAGI